MKMLDHKKGNAAGVQSFILTIVGVGVILAVGLVILVNLGAGLDADSAAANATTAIVTQLATVPTWIGILITVAMAFIVLGYFYTRQ